MQTGPVPLVNLSRSCNSASSGTLHYTVCTGCRVGGDDSLLQSWDLLSEQDSWCRAVAKASQRSSCASSQYGGYFSNPCDSSSSSATAGRRLFMQAPVVV